MHYLTLPFAKPSKLGSTPTILAYVLLVAVQGNITSV